MFQLDKAESETLKSQSVISSWGGSRVRPYAFTEQGVAMLSSVLRSETAVLVSIRIMDAFVAMRKAIASFAPMLMRFNAQYGNSLTVRTSDKFHDRFLIIDKAVLVHVGASLNHLGKKCFAFSSMDKSNIPDIVAKI